MCLVEDIILCCTAVTEQFCEAFLVCLGSHSLCCGIIHHVALRLYFWFFSIFLCVCSDRENVLSGRTRLLLLPGERKTTFVLCGDETWRCLLYYRLTPCCWRGLERYVSELKHCTNMSIFLLIWANILNLNSQYLLSGGLSRPSLVFPVCIFTSATGYLEPVRCLLYCLPLLQAAFVVHVSWDLRSI